MKHFSSSFWRSVKGIAASLLLAAALWALAGCEAFGIAAAALVPPSQDAVYEIEDRPTVVLVDDPKSVLRDPQMVQVVAASCAQVLRQESVISQVVDINEVTALAIEMGDKYAGASPYDIGRRLGAKQVIHVNVFSASASPEPGVLKPTAMVGVKLFDVDSRTRLFPKSAREAGVPESVAGDGFFQHTVSLRYKVSDDNPQRIMALARQKLAEETGSSIARLFFEHDPTKYKDMRAQ